jgi:hypothetical protein
MNPSSLNRIDEKRLVFREEFRRRLRYTLGGINYQLLRHINSTKLSRLNFLALLFHVLIWAFPAQASEMTLEEFQRELPARITEFEDDFHDQDLSVSEEPASAQLGTWIAVARELGVQFPQEASPEFTAAYEALLHGEPLMWKLRYADVESNILEEFLYAEHSGSGISFLVDKYEISYDQALALVAAQFSYTFQITSEADHRIFTFIVNHTTWHTSIESLQKACGRDTGACVTWEGGIHLMTTTSIGVIGHEWVHAFLQFRPYTSPALTTSTINGVQFTVQNQGLPWPGVMVSDEEGNNFIVDTRGAVEVEAVILSILFTASFPHAEDSTVDFLNWETISYLDESPRWQTIRNIIANFPAHRRRDYIEASRNQDLQTVLQLLGESISDAELNALIAELRASTDPRVMGNPILQDLLNTGIPTLDVIHNGRTDVSQGLILLGIYSALVSEQYAEGIGDRPMGYQRVITDYRDDGVMYFRVITQSEFTLHQLRGTHYLIGGSGTETIENNERREFYRLLDTGVPGIFGNEAFERANWLDHAAGSIFFSSEASAAELEIIKQAYPESTIIDVTDPNWKFNALTSFFGYMRFYRPETEPELNYWIQTMTEDYFVLESHTASHQNAINMGFFDANGNLSFYNLNTTNANYIIPVLLADSLFTYEAARQSTTYEIPAERSNIFNALLTRDDYLTLVEGIASGQNATRSRDMLQAFAFHEECELITYLSSFVELDAPDNDIAPSPFITLGILSQNEELVSAWLRSVPNNWTEAESIERGMPWNYLSFRYGFSLTQAEYQTYLDAGTEGTIDFHRFLEDENALEISLWGLG